MGVEAPHVDPLRINSAASTNTTLVRAGHCNLLSLAISNSGAAAAFVKLYDKATAPVLASDIPALTIPVPASGLATLPMVRGGHPFKMGLAIAITNLVADNNATAVALNQVKIFGTIAS